MATMAPMASMKTPSASRMVSKGPVHPNAAEQGCDDGGAGDDDQGSEEDGQTPTPPQKPVARQSGPHEGDHGPDGEQAPNGEGLPSEAADIDVQPSLEEDHRHGEPHHVVHGVSQGGRIDHPE